eukprot:4449059-Lingulodinium_polyedra.AAC.1
MFRAAQLTISYRVLYGGIYRRPYCGAYQRLYCGPPTGSIARTTLTPTLECTTVSTMDRAMGSAG